MNRTLDLDGTSYSLGIGSFGMGFNIGAGFKFVITENIYALVGYEYTFSLIGHGTWNLQDAGEDGGSPKDQDIYNNQGTNYNDFSDNFNFDGMKIIFGVGFLF
jgi:opacity protein-like surface antigen